MLGPKKQSPWADLRVLPILWVLTICYWAFLAVTDWMFTGELDLGIIRIGAGTWGGAVLLLHALVVVSLLSPFLIAIDVIRERRCRHKDANSGKDGSSQEEQGTP